MASKVVGIILKAEADDVHEAASELAWGGATLLNDSSETVWWQFKGTGALWAPQGHPQGHQQCCPLVAGIAPQLRLL